MMLHLLEKFYQKALTEMKFLILFILLFNTFNIYALNIEKTILSAAEKRDWGLVDELISKTKNNLVLKTVLSQKILDKNYPNNTFKKTVNFLNQNPYWPQQNPLKRAAESFIGNSTDLNIINKWFSNHPPQTSNGYKYRGIAAGKIFNDPNYLTPILKEAWIYGEFSESEEKEYLNEYSKYLSNNDHIQKVSEYLWNNNIINAKKYLKFVDKNYHKSFNFEIAILENQPDIDKKFRKINSKYYTSSLLYRYLLYKKKQKYIPKNDILKIISYVSDTKYHTDEWTKLLIYYSREYLEQKKYKSSYYVISSHFAQNSDEIREAEWLAGWLALRFLNKPKLALTHFQKTLPISNKPMSMSRAYYWIARSHKQNGDIELANNFYNKAAKFSYYFYGQLALVELGEENLILPPTPVIDDKHHDHFQANQIMQTAKILAKCNSKLAPLYARSAIPYAKSSGEIALIVNFFKKHNYTLSNVITTAKIASQHHTYLLNHLYPTPHSIKLHADKPLVYSVIRQESVFDTSAVSPKKAMGLMQMIKDTACDAASQMKIKCYPSKLTKDLKYSLKLGSWHLNKLFNDREGSYILTLASYNADPIHSKRWASVFGDPRDITNLWDSIDWIESIPFAETRNYVQRVLENLQIYRKVINKDDRLSIAKDLLHNNQKEIQ